jgi:hypothetical protein
MLETLPKFPRISGIDEKVFAKALESLGVDWDRTLPIPKTLLSSVIIMGTTIGIGTVGRASGALSHKLFAA